MGNVIFFQNSSRLYRYLVPYGVPNNANVPLLSCLMFNYQHSSIFVRSMTSGL